MHEATKVLAITAVACLAFLLPSCGSDRKARTEPAKAEHPQGEHPKGEHPQGEHPKGEHPQGEHPKKPK